MTDQQIERLRAAFVRMEHDERLRHIAAALSCAARALQNAIGRTIEDHFPGVTVAMPHPRSPARAKRRAAMGHPQAFRALPLREAGISGVVAHLTYQQAAGIAAMISGKENPT